MKLQIFKDAKLNLDLEKDGFVIIPFLDEPSLAELKTASETFTPNHLKHFFATTHSPDLALRKRANHNIQKGIKSSCERVFDLAVPLGGAFISKPPNGGGVLAIHQDWNIVDEQHFRSFNIWIPLVDTTIENGAVHVLKASHNKEQTLRGPGIPFNWKGLESEIYPKMEALEMKAGEALVYDHALWHSSPPNKSSMPRPAIVIGMIQKDTPMRAWFGDKNQVSEYELTPHYFFDELDITKPTTLKKVRTFEFANPEMTKRKLEDLYLPKSAEKWWQNLFRI